MPVTKKPRPSLDTPAASTSSSIFSPLSQLPSQQNTSTSIPSLSLNPMSTPISVPLPALAAAPLPSHPTDLHKQNRFRIPVKDISSPSLDIELGEKDLDSTAFPPSGLILTDDWNPKDEHANLGTSRSFLLENFSVLKNQTLVFKITVPLDSKRWSVNLGPPEMISPTQQQASAEDESWKNIFYHFNPRYAAKRKEFIQCDLNDGHWGVTDRRPFTAFSVLPTGNFTLMIQVTNLHLPPLSNHV
jgi:hypothetical protein